ncbi:glycerol-3-phosphate dehydrogenase, mitochondrial isoform X1 [Solea senegalensis]|uniref:glycerol-3-phosphate dehydrogenase n=1 Tax=Solea senegalensis TaxID=28829 RepID=A0AAV6RD58_SOLSE|nr:glycerol-3-phosphate dehydrogenase, mitochondrial isoform X1 [Solea senegalensis]
MGIENRFLLRTGSDCFDSLESFASFANDSLIDSERARMTSPRTLRSLRKIDLKTAPVHRDNFSSGSSSRSTKLIHGGVRYLQKAIMKLDYKQKPYFAICMNIRGSWSVLTHHACLSPPQNPFPHSHKVKCEPPISSQRGVQAYRKMIGQHIDARMNLAVALTAARYGAAIANYTEVMHLLKRADPQTGTERVCGAHCGDVITGQEFDVGAKCVINAMGPFTDTLWKMDDQKNPDIYQPNPGLLQPGPLVPSPPQQTKGQGLHSFVEEHGRMGMGECEEVSYQRGLSHCVESHHSPCMSSSASLLYCTQFDALDFQLRI